MPRERRSTANRSATKHIWQISQIAGSVSKIMSCTRSLSTGTSFALVESVASAAEVYHNLSCCVSTECGEAD
jgi:hypothetical protein